MQLWRHACHTKQCVIRRWLIATENNKNNHVIESGLVKCEPCLGTGKYVSMTVSDGTCFRCKGSGSEKAMTIKQYKFIKTLFMLLVGKSIIVEHGNEWHTMVNTMLNHKNGVTLQSSRWASDKIEAYKSRLNRLTDVNKKQEAIESQQPELFEESKIW